MFHVAPLMECIFLNFVFFSCLFICKPWWINYLGLGRDNARNKCLTAKLLNRVIGIISLERLFPSSIADTMN